MPPRLVRTATQQSEYDRRIKTARRLDHYQAVCRFLRLASQRSELGCDRCLVRAANYVRTPASAPEA